MSVPPFDPRIPTVQSDAAADVPTVNQRIRRVRPNRAAAAPARYRPLHLHARGGVGEVYRAEDAERPAEAEGYARRAVAVLQELRSQPILAKPETLKQLTTHADFAPLRDRDDFRALLAEMQSSKSPKK